MQLDYVNIVLKDIETTKRFYIDVLDFEQTKPFLVKGQWVKSISSFKEYKDIAC